MSSQIEKAKHFRSLHIPHDPLILKIETDSAQ